MKSMHIEQIASYIDAEIERLKMARDLLAGGSVPVKKRARKPVPVAPVVAAPAAPAKEPVVQRIAPRAARGSARAGKRHTSPKTSVAGKTHMEPLSALSGPVPAGPVAVSANEARNATARRVQGDPAPLPQASPAAHGERTLASLIAKLGPASRQAGDLSPLG